MENIWKTVKKKINTITKEHGKTYNTNAYSVSKLY